MSEQQFHKEVMAELEQQEDAKAKKIRDAYNERVRLLKLANAELKAENDAAEAKYFQRIYDENKSRFLAKCYSEELSDSLAKSVCQYEDNKLKGYSNE